MTEEVKVELFLRKATGLVKEVGPVGAFILPWATMAGSGITFYSIQVIYYYPQGSVPLAFLMVGVPTILNAVVIAILGVCTPRSAGGYVWSTRFVDPFFGWFGSGWIYWLSYVFTVALVSYVLGSVYSVIFIIMGSASGITPLHDFGVALQTNVGLQQTFIIITVIITGIVAIIEIKHYMKILFVIWGLNTLGLVVSMFLFASNNPSTVPGVWNSVWGAGSYETINSLAAKYDIGSYISGTSKGLFDDTLSIVAYIFWAITGYETVGYVAGEIRKPRVSFLYWFMAGMVVTVLWYAGVTALAYNAYGDFILKYNFVYNLYSGGQLAAEEAAKVASYMLTPSMPLFSASLTKVPVLQILAAWWFWPISVALVSYLVATRSMFGMAFDRMFPEAFGAVNDRTHTPIKATLFTLVISIIWALVMFTAFGYLVSAANTSFWTAFYYLIYSAAAIALPYKRPDIWEKGVKRRIFGIPESTLIGALSAAGMLWILALSSLGISLLAWNVSSLWMLIGILIFVYYVHKNMKRGINIASIYQEIPPP